MVSEVNAPGRLPHWDLSNIYPGLESAPFAEAIADLKSRLDELDVYLAARHIAQTAGPIPPDPLSAQAIIDGYLDRMNATLRLHGALNAYVAGHVTTNSYDTTAKRLLSELELLGVRLQQQSTRFQGWLGRVADMLPSVLALEGLAQAHAFFLRETVQQSRFLMSAAEESLAAELGLSGENAWSKLHGTVCSQLTVHFERDGKTAKIPITALQNIHWHDPDPEVRRRAYHAELAAWESVREPLAAALNGVKGAVNVLNRRRGRVDAVQASIDQSRIDRETLETLIGVLQESFPMFRRYLQAKARRLGHPGALPWWDIFAPVGKHARRYTWPETQDFIVTQFRTFSDRLANLAQRAFAQHWIDAEPRAGKRGGAFCMKVLGLGESRILCNFDGSLDQVSTVAHELGHAFHNECQVGQTPLQIVTPMTLAETASIFCQTIITDAALAQAAGADEELAILETFLADTTQVIVDITSRFLFEQEVFARRARSELSAADFCAIMLRCQTATYGDGLDERYLHPYMWAWKPHYYRGGLSFYNYPYAFGLLFGLGLYALYQARGPAFVPEYEALLAGTGQANAADLAARFGIDIRRPEFWRKSLRMIEPRIQRYIALCQAV
ncbi:MAG TPA: M3 family oligoendopeptidase [Anaerolineae bacterium]|nr:M3 family oligoendopeptidase [Anaerolineae bacterium]